MQAKAGFGAASTRGLSRSDQMSSTASQFLTPNTFSTTAFAAVSDGLRGPRSCIRVTASRSLTRCWLMPFKAVSQELCAIHGPGWAVTAGDVTVIGSDRLWQ
jgi:hypothetical protein